jgi:hypothetical protein
MQAAVCDTQSFATAHPLRQWRHAINNCRMNHHDSIFPTLKICRTSTKPNHISTTMNKLITITLAAVTLIAVSSCNTSKKAPASQNQSMPGMSAAEHAKM